MITVFTSTYNRAYRLGNLYASLKRQTSKAFEWIVINDGSTDGTEELLETVHDAREVDVFRLKIFSI